MDKLQIRYIEANTIGRAISGRHAEFWRFECSDLKGKRGIEADLSVFNDAWMKL